MVCATQYPGARAAGNSTNYWQCQQDAEPPATRAPRPDAAHTIQKTPPTVYTYSYNTHTPKFIYIYTRRQHAHGKHTAQAYKQTHALTHTSTHTHTIQIILYTQIHNTHVHNIYIYNMQYAHIQYTCTYAL